MLVFVIPLRNPETAKDWERCNALCQQTVRSALNQVDGDVRVIVVCKEFAPDIEDERLTILRYPFPTPEQNWEKQDQDKYRKLAHGMVEARKYAPCYIMKLDADDLLNRHLSQAVKRTQHKPGYYIPHGYLWSEGSMVLRPVDNFHLHCGSSNIIWSEKDDLPPCTDSDMSRCRILMWGHHTTVQEFHRLGSPLMPLPLRSAIYRKGNGENLSSRLLPSGFVHTEPNWKFYIGRLLSLTELRPLTPSIRRDFFG